MQKSKDNRRFINWYYLIPYNFFCSVDNGSILSLLRKSAKSIGTSHNRAVQSPEPVSIVFPSREKATEDILLVCPLNSCIIFPSSPHKRAVLSSEPVRIVFPLGEKANEVISSICPLNSCIIFPFNSHNRA